MLTSIVIVINLLTTYVAMNYSKGGRGKQAPYKTTHCRVPETCKSFVDRLVSVYKKMVDDPKASLELLENVSQVVNKTYSDFAGLEVKTVKTKDVNIYNETILSKAEAVDFAKKMLRAKKSKVDSLEKLLTSIYGEDVNLTNL